MVLAKIFIVLGLLFLIVLSSSDGKILEVSLKLGGEIVGYAFSELLRMLAALFVDESFLSVSAYNSCNYIFYL